MSDGVRGVANLDVWRNYRFSDLRALSIEQMEDHHRSVEWAYWCVRGLMMISGVMLLASVAICFAAVLSVPLMSLGDGMLVLMGAIAIYGFTFVAGHHVDAWRMVENTDESCAGLEGQIKDLVERSYGTKHHARALRLADQWEALRLDQWMVVIGYQLFIAEKEADELERLVGR